MKVEVHEYKLEATAEELKNCQTVGDAFVNIFRKAFGGMSYNDYPEDEQGEDEE